MTAPHAAPGRWLSIIGIGEDGVHGLTPKASERIERADLVVGGARHLALAAPLIRGERLAWPQPMDDAYSAILDRRGGAVAVLASGDPNWFGVAAALRRIVPAAETVCLPAPSAFSLACARLGWALQDVATVSFCGRPTAALLPLLQPGACILALSADASTPAAIAALLLGRGFQGSRLHILEAMGGPRERHRTVAPADVPRDVDPLNLIGIEVAAEAGSRVIPSAPGLPDDWFEHDGQITKREVRAVTIAALAPRGGELLWDVGCGSGSIGIEWSLSHPAARAVAIDRRPDRAARALRNAEALGVPSLRVVVGPAPEALADLPSPDAVFIGGGAQAPGVLDAAWAALRPGGRCVVNAVTVETEALLFAAHGARGGTLTRLHVDHLESIGRMRGFRPAMTVTQWTGLKP
jgi:precorrin-6Y C5,15-methyltransferase (decarboxylating)